MIGSTMLKPVQYLDNGTSVRCLCCNQIFTNEEIEEHMEEFCFPPSKSSDKIAYRIEISKREPCWHCSKALVNIYGKCCPPYVAYIAQIMGFDRKLHRRCAEGLGYKCTNQK